MLLWTMPSISWLSPIFCKRFTTSALNMFLGNNSCRYFLQVYQAVSELGNMTFFSTLNISFTFFSISLACFVIFSLFATKQLKRSPIMMLFLYACLNDILFAAMGQIYYTLQFHSFTMHCQLLVIVVFITKFTHTLALNIMLLIARGQ